MAEWANATRKPGADVGTADAIILPDAIIEHLRQLADSNERGQWEIGDFLVSVLDELGPAFESMGVKRARPSIIRQLANRTGLDSSTLRDRESMCRFFPVKARDHYHALTYHQLRSCKSAGDNWRKYADWALVNLPAPVSVIRAKVKANGHECPAWVSRWDRMTGLADVVLCDTDSPGWLKLLARLIAVWH
jgi:hypothetical protein